MPYPQGKAGSSKKAAKVRLFSRESIEEEEEER